MTWLRRVALVAFFVGTALSPVHAAASKVPMPIAYDDAVGPIATTRIAGLVSARRPQRDRGIVATDV